ncbi:hypothetical protein HLH34_01210 [Gluconacetobacter azotocaptans]|uniref:Uncharacterized protein n=1 Tax=Gluconacetobacter azotocaptans TaxID=142834 RepID=A0A7W4JPN3_9PROT|nr:hypothetical protein [Gluconacetobacter azotocaptans]MBB2188582.1 hypothetical protein [Gluconacetobacter azotocaptans]MBM9400287.1 hypothetical protein [Gluconacetobacter azotocaptans]GBQ28198.1 hypothetical protein AA13594_0902 [Gluconacetobacter azotocaptans DSM 13594]
MTGSTTLPSATTLRVRRVPDWCATFAIASFGAFLSIVLSGQIGGQLNNFYHLSILAGLYNEPQFANDLFIQSLRFYSSGFWQLLSDRVHGQDVYAILFVFQILSRTLLFLGFLSWASLLGLESPKERLVFTALLAVSSTLHAFSNAGGGGLLINNFTQSELANGTTLLALAWAARGRVTAAFAMNGVTFFINAFIAVWTAVPLAFILLSQWRRHKWTWTALLLQGCAGLALFGLLAAPVVYNILVNPYVRPATDFDYITYLTSFFPDHFLIWTISFREACLLASIFCCGVIAAQMLRAPNSYLTAALCGAATVWIFGAFLPFATHARMLLNLHLLRSGSSVHLLAATAIATLSTRWIFSRDETERLVWAPVLVLLSCSIKLLLPLAIPLLLWHRTSPALSSSWRVYAPAALLLPVVLYNAARIYHAVTSDRAYVAQRDEWQAVGTWARTQTKPDAVFLAPPGALRDSGVFPKTSADQEQLFEGGVVFPYFSHRQAWVFSQAGAAVMWAPAYYQTWQTRITEVRTLKTLPQRLSYAADHGIAYVVDGCTQPYSLPPAARFDRLCVFAVPGVSTP